MASKMESKYGLREPIFQKAFKNGKVCLDCAGVNGLQMSPSREALRVTQKTKKKASLFPKGFFEGANTNICENMVPKCLQKGDFISVVSPLGRSWRTFGIRSRFLTKKVKPESSKRVAKGPNVTPKGSQRHSNCFEMVHDSTVRFHTNSLREIQARRTARSAYNNCANHGVGK